MTVKYRTRRKDLLTFNIDLTKARATPYRVDLAFLNIIITFKESVTSMKISKRIYVDKDIPHYKWKLWKLRKGKKLDNIYCLVYKENSFLEIIKSNRIKDSYSKSILIGMATTKQGAIELLVRIFDEVYVPNPNIQDMKDYFITENT